jgi:hypothetical protein
VAYNGIKQRTKCDALAMISIDSSRIIFQPQSSTATNANITVLLMRKTKGALAARANVLAR